MIYLQMAITLLEILLCLNIYHILNKKRFIPLLILAFLFCGNMRSIQAIWAIHMFICLIVMKVLSKFIKPLKPKLCLLLAFILSIGICTYGYVNMQTIHKTEYRLTTNKNIKPTKICFISDVHYPNANNEKRLKKIVQTLQKKKPSFYLLGGDFVDESTSLKDTKILFKNLGKLTKVAPVYYVYGNHENKIKFPKNTLNQIIKQNRIKILNDQKITKNNITIIGRSDYTNLNRKKTKQYHLSNKTYNIVLDHQPQGEKENINNKVNLQLSGHTHNGQIMPLSISYHLQPDFAGNYGKTTKKQYTKIISSGLVGWGFPLRTEGKCEYVIVDIKKRPQQ